MMINFKSLTSLKNLLFASAAVCLLAQCSTEDDMVAPTLSEPQEISADGNVESNISSVTITGLNTTLSGTSLDCTTCTYVVANTTDVVDGAALGLKAGSVICLDEALKYGDLEFVNLEGTEENPIIIGSTRFPASSN